MVERLAAAEMLERFGKRSVRNRPGGLPRAPDGTGRLAVVRPVRPMGRTAIFG